MIRTFAAAFVAALAVAPVHAENYPDKLLWGDTHLHTNLSVDAYFLGNRTADADTAYRFAKGEPVIHPYTHARAQLREPLDFLAVTDHAELLGVPYRLLTVGDERLTHTRLGRKLIELANSGRGEDAFGLFILAINQTGLQDSNGRPPKVGLLKALKWRFMALVSVPDAREQANEWLAGDPTLIGDLNQPDVIRTSWESNIDAAERNNEPGKFTTFIGWEYSSTPDGANLHRCVFTPAGGDVARKFLPFSAVDSPNPEDLWRWLEKTKQETGADFVAIPHNSNLSKGRMFATVDYEGKPLTPEIAKLRAEWETVAEVTQTKGTSETRPELSPNDEFADFEFFNRLIDARTHAQHAPTVTPADYVRSALKTGLELESSLGVNPFKLGMIGATDSHTALSSTEENNFYGAMPPDGAPANREIGFKDVGVKTWQISASGLAAVWARENTRQAIFDAFKRREVYGTTGPHIRLRFFGGFAFTPDDAGARDIAAVGYAKGVPMGGDLTRAQGGAAPSFLIRAVKDPMSANLDRVQVVKGWIGPDGKAQEKVFNVAWSGDRAVDANGRLPPVGNTVDVKTASYTNTIGDSELATVWKDPEFNPDQRAFYYVRVLEIPTPRNSLYDSVALGEAPPEGLPTSIQERAYSSPIWYTP